MYWDFNAEQKSQFESDVKDGRVTPFCVFCGSPLTGAHARHYCCDEHEGEYQAQSRLTQSVPVHEQPYVGKVMHRYDRASGQPISYPASKYGEAIDTPPNPYLTTS